LAATDAGRKHLFNPNSAFEAGASCARRASLKSRIRVKANQWRDLNLEHELDIGVRVVQKRSHGDQGMLHMRFVKKKKDWDVIRIFHGYFLRIKSMP
jgi:hypothetical protein